MKILQNIIGELSFKGLLGDLFVITDNKTGQLWGVSDISGNDICYADDLWNIQFGNPLKRNIKMRRDASTNKNYISLDLNSYADHLSASSDTNLLTGELYRLNTDNIIYQK